MKVFSAPSKFSFVAAPAAIDSALGKLNASVSSGSGVREFALTSVKGKLWALGYSSDSYAFIRIDGVTTSGEGSFLIDPSVFAGVLKGRSEIKFEFTGRQIKYQVVKGSYKGDLNVGLIDDTQAKVLNNVSAPMKDSSSPITREVFDRVRAGVQATSIMDVFNNSPLFKYIDISAKGVLSVFSTDQHHVAYSRSIVKGAAPFRLTLPGTHFSIIDRVLEDEQATISISAENIRIAGKSFLLVLPALQADDKNFEVIPNYVRSLDKSKFSCEAAVADVKLLSGNFSALVEKNTQLSFSASSGKLNLTFQNRNGSASDSLKVQEVQGKLKAEVTTDVMLFNDLVKTTAITGNAKFSIGDRWLVFSGSSGSKASLSYIAVLTSFGE